MREHLTHYKGKHSQNPSINDIVIVYEEKQPRQRWRLGKIVELIERKDKNIRSAKILIGKTQNFFTRPIISLYPVEFSEEFNPVIQSDMETNERTKTRKNTAVIADLKRTFHP